MLQEDLTPVPPKREINFGIELLLNILPIIMAPYYMVVAEFEDLMQQQEDL